MTNNTGLTVYNI